MIGLIVGIAWFLCFVQAVRVMLGFIVGNRTYLDGEDIFLIVVGVVFSAAFGPGIVLVRFVYWLWCYYDVSNRVTGQRLRRFIVQPQVETKAAKQQRVEREAKQKVAELRGQVADHRG